MKRVLVTGPVDRLADYAQAARAAGWEAVEAPLLGIEARRFRPEELRRTRYDWICLTSASALPWLESALAAVAELQSVPCAVVGERTAERARDLGLVVEMPPATDAASLAVALGSRARAGARVLWPRGSLSEDLARELRDRGLEVEDPLAYETHVLAAAEKLPASSAVFFASASAVRAWHARPEGDDPAVAITIGRSTFDALLQETPARFFDTISLPQPTPEALGAILAHLDR